MSSAGPDAGGEGFDGGKAELLVEMHGGAIFGGNGEREFRELQGTQGFRRREHEKTPQAVSLESWHDANLRSVADTGRDFTGEDRAHQIFAAGMAQDEGGVGHELAAARQENNVFQEFQRAMPRAVLIVDIAINVIRISQIN